MARFIGTSMALAAGVLASTTFLAKHAEAQQPGLASIVGALHSAAGSATQQQQKSMGKTRLGGGANAKLSGGSRLRNPGSSSLASGKLRLPTSSKSAAGITRK